MLLLQGQLALGVPESAQGVQPVLQQASVSIALVPTHGAQPLSQLGRVLGLKRQDLEGGKTLAFRQVL